MRNGSGNGIANGSGSRRPIARDEGTFALDADFLKREARDGLSTFFAPLSGVYHAAIGRPHSREH